VTKVQRCRDAIERHDLQTAKSLYNELREEFPSAQVEGNERQRLYTSIRELYDDIHLMMLA
jgi:uncharacterized membrane protein YcjF (UPF0283 family)